MTERMAPPRGDLLGATGKLVYCPECGQLFEDPAELGPHLERHRPVKGPVKKNGKLLSKRCPEKCGRWFLKEGEGQDFKDHRAMCDGSMPLRPGRPSDGDGKACKEHELGTALKEAIGELKAEKELLEGRLRRISGLIEKLEKFSSEG